MPSSPKLPPAEVPQWWCILGTVSALIVAETKRDATSIMIGRVLGDQAQRREMMHTHVRAVPATEAHARFIEQTAAMQLRLDAAKPKRRQRAKTL